MLPIATVVVALWLLTQTHETPLVGVPMQDGSALDLSVPSNRFGMMAVDWQAGAAPTNSFGNIGPSPIVGAPIAEVSYIPGGPLGWGMPTWQQAWQQACRH